MNVSRRNILAGIAAALPALAITSKSANAWTPASASDVGMVPASGNWAVLERVTDGTDPSTAVVAAPNFTPEIRKLAGTEVTLSGYLQPVSGGFGKQQDYLLSRGAFHCPYCYAFGRGSLALATIAGHVPQSNGKVTVTGTLALQETDPSDFYFQLKNAKIG